MKKILIIPFAFFCLSCSQNSEPWKKNQLLEPNTLSEMILKKTKLPHIISIGPGAVIDSSISVGETRFSDNFDKLNEILKSIDKKDQIILYCGCCPFEHCQNIRPAFSLLNDLGYKNHSLLNLSNNIKTDWIDLGYPTKK
jgi:hypothetical protein